MNAPGEIKISNVRVGSLIIAANSSKGRHWGQGYLETGRNMSGTLQGLEHFA